MHAIARLTGNRRAINRSPVNFNIARLDGWAGRVTITHTCSDAPHPPISMHQAAKFRLVYLYLHITCTRRQTLVLVTEKALMIFLAVTSAKLTKKKLTVSVHIVLKVIVLQNVFVCNWKILNQICR